jgi:hypothetical protein
MDQHPIVQRRLSERILEQRRIRAARPEPTSVTAWPRLEQRTPDSRRN